MWKLNEQGKVQYGIFNQRKCVRYCVMLNTLEEISVDFDRHGIFKAYNCTNVNYSIVS